MLTADETPLLMLPGTLCDERVFEAATSGLGRQRYTIEMAGELSAPEMARRVLELAPPRAPRWQPWPRGVMVARIEMRH